MHYLFEQTTASAKDWCGKLWLWELKKFRIMLVVAACICSGLKLVFVNMVRPEKSSYSQLFFFFTFLWKYFSASMAMFSI